MVGDAECVHHEPIEVPGEEVREVEGGRIVAVHAPEAVGAGEELVAVRTRQPLDAELGTHVVDRSGGATVGVADEHEVEPVVVAFESTAKLGSDVRGTQMQGRRQALDAQIDHVVQLADRLELVDERATGQHEYPGRPGHDR